MSRAVTQPVLDVNLFFRVMFMIMCAVGSIVALTAIVQYDGLV